MTFGAGSGRALVEVALRPDATAELPDAAGAFVQAAAAAPPEEVSTAIEELAVALRQVQGEPLVILANVVGYLAERGVEPGAVADVFADRLVAVAASARALADAALRETADGGMDANDEEHPEIFEQARLGVASRHPDAARDWDVLAGLLAPALAILDEAGPARGSAQRCLPDIEALEPYHEAAHWIGRFLRVLYDEPFVAIELASRTAIRGRLAGISENFQLNVLLMDAFPKPGFLARSRVSKSAAATARGDGPQQTDEVVVGSWDTFGWTALRSDGSLPSVNEADFSENAIWNEGSPADIPVFEGWRVILLAPPSYGRSWRAQRDFPRLRAGLGNVEQLSRDETTAWIERLKSAAADRRDRG